MGGSSEKSLSDWMMRQGMVRRDQAGRPREPRLPLAGVPPRGAVGGGRTITPREQQGVLWVPPPAQHSPTPFAPASTAPQCPLPAPDSEARPGGPSGRWELTGARWFCAKRQQRAEWERELVWAAQSTSCCCRRYCCWEVGSCSALGSSGAGDRAWGQSRLGWRKTVALPLFPEVAE